MLNYIFHIVKKYIEYKKKSGFRFGICDKFDLDGLILEKSTYIKYDRHGVQIKFKY